MEGLVGDEVSGILLMGYLTKMSLTGRGVASASIQMVLICTLEKSDLLDLAQPSSVCFA